MTIKLNILKYKKLLWNKDYGDFGIMQMSINVVIFFVSITTLFFFAFYVLIPIYKFIRNIYLVNFDIKPFIADLMNLKFVFLNLDIEKIMILYVLLVISFTIIYLSHKNAKEKLNSFYIWYVGQILASNDMGFFRRHQLNTSSIKGLKYKFAAPNSVSFPRD